ncbi:leucine-rich repeat domain-containing protein [Cochleicola gelatinilyticus]|uniref:Disease resistance R13L4/SHOC-2-like LRR domain-containing protein n=1 Tax=Cochleicola gelatinilyticus TaxID=1763537 RepID=A0A167HPS2_9FLAO|nr:hypothetical protein [Cochleicola gelatinilyticus]OAB78836.1 hypothetical protein ULVI_09655 [Cochleicola gelatinilyticus]
MKNTLLTLVALLASTLMYAEVPQKEKQALIDFYIATDGENWVNTWELNEPVENWQGVTVENNTVTGISLLFNKIKGTLPASIGDLENLKVLELSFNEISGSLPESIGKLTKLELLAFNGNFLTGIIPSSIGNLVNLKQLHLSSNQLTGTLPYSLNNLKNIIVFNVFDNKLYGSLPEDLATTQSLREVMIAENNFDNTNIFSIVMLSNSGVALDLEKPAIQKVGNSVIAIETPDDEN